TDPPPHLGMHRLLLSTSRDRSLTIQRDGGHVHVIKALLPILGHGILNLFPASAGSTAPPPPPHVLIASIGGISPEEGAPYRADTEALDLVANADGPEPIQLLAAGDGRHNIVSCLPDVGGLAIGVERNRTHPAIWLLGKVGLTRCTRAA